jgi:Zn-dependent peptidase ImmA (M78 family)
MATFERGFKAWAERVSVSLRKDLKAAPSDPMPLRQLAEYLGARLLTPDDVEGLPKHVRDQLLKHDPDGWSAVTCMVGGQQTIIYNSAHVPQRQSSDIAHELAHLVLGHEPGQIVLSQSGDMCMRSFNEREESEANWLAGALLVPREALVASYRSGFSEDEFCQQYQISKKMLNWRLSVTGVIRQAQRSAASRGRGKLA